MSNLSVRLLQDYKVRVTPWILSRAMEIPILDSKIVSNILTHRCLEWFYIQYRFPNINIRLYIVYTPCKVVPGKVKGNITVTKNKYAKGILVVTYFSRSGKSHNTYNSCCIDICWNSCPSITQWKAGAYCSMKSLVLFDHFL